MRGRRAAWPVPAAVAAALAACGGAAADARDPRDVGAADRAGPGAAGAGAAAPRRDLPPTAGTDADVLARVFDLGAEPSIPRAFGAARPTMTPAEARRALPAAWGDAWTHAPADEPGVVLHAGRGDAAARDDEPLGVLAVVVRQWDARARLAAAWGAPDASAYDARTACWLAPAARLKACQHDDLDGQLVELGAYEPLADALGRASPRALDRLAALHGAPRADVLRAFPRAVEHRPADDPSQHRIEASFPATEYLADVRADRAVFWIDRAGRVGHVHVRFGASDPALRPALVAALRAAADDARRGAPSSPSITILDGEPIDVVVVIDRDADLR